MPDQDLPTSTRRLLDALHVNHAPQELIDRATANEFHDYLSPHVDPIGQLVIAARAAGLRQVADRAIDGYYDATREESDAWVRSPDGQATLAEFGLTGSPLDPGPDQP